ncbi:helix-turn-helix domain-containing protein [Paenibacillus sp. HB172176]|uniref:helix-turn-helix domain-containing protein n=1 Tax=Paenibacillus sp. HB172176 TaxID=2493690 RepID=UPI00143AE473|nr:helix-turn-helix domain-containing protein [Paenibacillus sp. HB172176]
MGRNYYRRLLFTYLPVLSCTVAIIILIFVAIINGLMIDNAKQANQATTRFMSQVVDDTLKNIELELFKELLSNEGLRPFFIVPPGDSDIMLSYDASHVMSAMMVRYDIIQSMALYRDSDHMVLDQSSIRPLGEYPDRALIEEGMGDGVQNFWTAPRMTETSGVNEGTQVVTLVYKVSNQFGLILVNVPVSAIKNILSDMVNTSTGAFELIDQNSQAFFASGDRLSNDGVLDASVRSTYTGWTLHSGLNNGNRFSLVVDRSIVWIVLGALVITIGVFLTIYFTRQHYRPVERIIKRVSSAARLATGEPGSSEFEFIDQAVQNLIMSNMAYATQHERDRTYREQQLIHGLLLGTLKQSEEESERMLAELGYAIPKQAFVALMEIDEYAEFCGAYTVSDQALLKFVKRSVAGEILQKSGHPHVVEWISKNRMAIVMMSSGNQKTLSAAINDCVEQIRKWIDSNLNYTVTFGIGSEATRLNGLASSCEDAAIALGYKMSVGPNRVIAFSELDPMRRGNVTQDLKLLQQLIQAYRLGNREWEKHAGELFRQLKQNLQSRDDTVRLLQYFLYLLGAEFETMGKETARQWNETQRPALQEALAEKDTLEELEPIFMQTLREWFGQLSELNLQRDHFTLLRDIRQYISDFYYNPDLSLIHLSEKFEVNAKYLSQLFKEETGVNFSDFLIELRIEGAKRLLEETDDSLQSITDQVGYTNAISFSRLFKKQVGMTPIHYRKQQRKAGKTK